MKKYILIALYIHFISIATAQNIDTLPYPVVGQHMTGFTLHNIAYYQKKQASLKDFKGKWLILDFWTKDCGGCIASFPSKNRIQQELSDKVQVMMVGYQDKEKKIEPMYARYREKENLIMPCAFDSSLITAFQIWGFPRVFLIDPNGIVRCISSTLSLTDMKAFIAGNTPERFQPKQVVKANPYDSNKPFGIANNGTSDSDFIFRSVFTQWKPSLPLFNFDPPNIHTGMLNALGIPLQLLYNYAYIGAFSWGDNDTSLYGKYYDKPVLDNCDTSLFNFNFSTTDKLFCYSLSMPGATCTKELMQAAMQRDLQTYFNYDVRIEKRMCPYWKLTALPNAMEKLKTKGGQRKFTQIIYKADFSYTNSAFPEFFKWLRRYLDGNERDKYSTIVLDETGIGGNIDIKMECVMTDLPSIIMALQFNGLDLVKAQKEMKVVVIRKKGKSDTPLN